MWAGKASLGVTAGWNPTASVLSSGLQEPRQLGTGGTNAIHLLTFNTLVEIRGCYTFCMAIKIISGSYYTVNTNDVVEALNIYQKVQDGTATAEEQALVSNTDTTGFEAAGEVEIA